MRLYAKLPLNAIISLAVFAGPIDRLKSICPVCVERVPFYYLGTDGECLDCHHAAQVSRTGEVTK